MVLTIRPAQSNASYFANALSNDSLIYASSGQRILLGTGADLSLTLSSSNVGINCIPTTGYALDVVGQIRASGDITAFSDLRFKHDLQHIPNALAKVGLLTGYTFRRTDATPADVNKRYVGVIAQEVQEVLPEAVHGDDMSGLSVAYGNLSALLVEAIKDLTSRVVALEQALASK